MALRTRQAELAHALPKALLAPQAVRFQPGIVWRRDRQAARLVRHVGFQAQQLLAFGAQRLGLLMLLAALVDALLKVIGRLRTSSKAG